MDVASVKELAGLDDEPAVSILCPLDPRRPGNARDATVLAQLRDDAVERLEHRLHGPAGGALIDRIHDAVDSVDLRHPTRGVAVFVSANVSRVIGLELPVGPHVVVGERFAIRELVTALLRTRPARIVVLSQAKTRCIDIKGDDATERLDCGFPVEVVPPTEADTPHGDFPLSEREHSEAVKFTFRAVEHALRALQHRGTHQLVIVGTERDLAYFNDVTEQHANIVGHVAGNYERATPDQLARLVQPVLEAHEQRAHALACNEARDGIGTHALSGIAEVWAAARSGRGRRLLVEDGYCYPARVIAGELTSAPEEDLGSVRTFDAASDTVDEVVRHDGDVVVVPPGSIADLGHIALLTRW
jgi:Bacterial archaeo-eukaryotic release factor family 3